MEKDELTFWLIAIILFIVIIWVTYLNYRIVGLENNEQYTIQKVNQGYNSIIELWFGVYNWTSDDLGNQLNCDEYKQFIGEDAMVVDISPTSLTVQFTINEQIYNLYYFKDKTILCSTEEIILDCREIFCES